ncbi:MAG TPA: hypothetical protein VF167_07710 [Longimicrobiaceae bacterium]
MRKPVSKNALRRAFDKALADGQLECTVPLNAVVDRIWHEMHRETYNRPRKKISRETVRKAAVTEPDIELL